MVVARVAMTDCITSLPSALSTATEIVSRWTSRPTYLMLFIGRSFRQALVTASHSCHSLLRNGRPFIMRAPGSRGSLALTWVFGYTSSALNSRPFRLDFDGSVHACSVVREAAPRPVFRFRDQSTLHWIGVN